MLKKREPDPAYPPVNLEQKPLSPEETKAMLGDVGENWLFGEGVGSTAINVGTIVAFPPYAIYVLGNSVLSLSGYEPLYVSNALPEEEREQFNSVYGNVAAGPGKLAAAVAGEEYRDQENIRDRMQKYVKPPETEGTIVQPALPNSETVNTP